MTQTATQLAAQIRSGRVTSREVTEQLLARIAADKTVNAVVETRPEYAVRAATAADEAVTAGHETGPLHGVPMTIKDAFAVAGMHNTWGQPTFADRVVDRDATVVERLTTAGAIIVGKTNVHAMLADFGQTANDVYGRTNNPIDPRLSPGGSSGGSAAALAAGLSYLEYGSDLVGSIRLPAAYCGVYGLKPTAGTVPLRGFAPPGPTQPGLELPSMSNVGPLATSATDLRTALQVTAGPVARSSYSWRLLPPRRKRLTDYRVGVVLDHEAAGVSADVGEVLSAFVDRIARAGAKIVTGWPAGTDPVEQAEAFGFQVGVTMAGLGESADFASLAEVIAHERRRMELRATWQRYFEDIDVFVCPTSFTTAFPHDDRPFDERTIRTSYGEQRYDAQVFWIAHASLTGLPALSMPAGHTATGLPVGAQVIGPWHEDDTAITFGELSSTPLD